MLIRQASASDANFLADLVFASAAKHLEQIFTVTAELSALNFLRKSFISSDGQYGFANHWVAEVEGQVVACVSAWHAQLPQQFHQATLDSVIAFYGAEQALNVVHNSQALADCIPKPQTHEWCIGHLSVTERHKKQGLGKALILAMQKMATAANKICLSLDVENTNQAAIDFYHRCGFAVAHKSAVSPRMQQMGINQHLHMVKPTGL